MVWHSCGPEILNLTLFHGLRAGTTRMCPSFELRSGSLYLHHDASSSWAPKGPGKTLTTGADSGQTWVRREELFLYFMQNNRRILSNLSAKKMTLS